MMSSKHTPGPWTKMATYKGHLVASVERTPGLPIVTAVAACEGKESEANARLIATAPELLDLLDRVAYHMEGGIRMEYPASPEESPQPASEWDHEADRLAGEARRLLAKATGDA